MDLFYELLKEACTCFLLSFLVVRFISLIVSFDDDDDFVSGSINNNGVKLSATVDSYHVIKNDDDHGKNNQKQISDYDDDDHRLKVFTLMTHKENEGINVRDIDFDSRVVENFIFDEEKLNSDGFDEKLVDLGRKIGGFEDNFGGDFEIGKKIVEIDCRKELGEYNEDESHEMGEILGRDQVLNSRSVCKGEISGRKLDDEGILSDDEEWEGIERSELEKRFAKAMNLVGCKDNEEILMKMGDEIMMKLQGLQKIAMEGMCNEPQPMALMRSARAKWNAWQKLGDMTREDAMERYIKLLSDSMPELMESHSYAKE
ncbi:unnamed protein product [Amaranthus hypochondriacus]